MNMNSTAALRLHSSGRSVHRLWILSLITGLMLLAGCDLPQDPENTLNRVKGGTLRVGVVENPPWVIQDGDTVRGVEADLVRQWAKELDARVDWLRGSESTLLSALQRHELDLVIGGLNKTTPWKKRVGLTKPYVETKLMIGLPPGTERQAGNWGGEPIAYLRSDPAIAASIRQQKGIPVAVTGPDSTPVATSQWQLEAWNFTPVGEPLRRHKHVIAVPSGENAFLLKLERFLEGRQSAILQELKTSPPKDDNGP